MQWGFYCTYMPVYLSHLPVSALRALGTHSMGLGKEKEEEEESKLSQSIKRIERERERQTTWHRHARLCLYV